MLFRKVLRIKTKINNCVDITRDVAKVVSECAFPEGSCNIFLKATTAGMTLNEADMLLKQDFVKLFKELVDEKKIYAHGNNSFSHLRASMLNQSLTIPVSGSALALGKWQSILLWEFDINERERELVVTISA